MRFPRRDWPTTLPVTSGWSRAQVRAEAVLVKKLRASQQTVAAGPEQLRLPRYTTVPPGCQTVVRSGPAVTVTASPVTGSSEVMTTSRASMAGMPSASIAHIDHTSAPPAIRTRCGVCVAENGYAARIFPSAPRVRKSSRSSSASTSPAVRPYGRRPAPAPPAPVPIRRRRSAAAPPDAPPASGRRAAAPPDGRPSQDDRPGLDAPSPSPGAGHPAIAAAAASQEKEQRNAPFPFLKPVHATAKAHDPGLEAAAGLP